MSYLEKQKLINKEAYQFYKSLGICVDCRTESAKKGKVRCGACAATVSEKNNTHRKLWLKELKNHPKLYEEHLKKQSEYRRQWRAKRRNDGFCGECFKRPVKEGMYLCHICIIKGHERRIRRNI